MEDSCELGAWGNALLMIVVRRSDWRPALEVHHLRVLLALLPRLELETVGWVSGVNDLLLGEVLQGFEDDLPVLGSDAGRASTLADGLQRVLS